MRALALLALLAAAATAAAAVLVRDEPAAELPRRAADRVGEAVRPGAVGPARCPSDADGCRVVTGRVVLVEAQDPDGDGDLHIVVADGAVTAPGLTAVDVRAGLRPRRSPRLGDRVTAAGPVQRGSYGQAQIHALDFAVAR